MSFKNWIEESLKIWSLLRDVILGKPKESKEDASADLSIPADVRTKAETSAIDDPITNLFNSPRPANTTQVRDLVTKCLAVLHWVDDHTDMTVPVSKDRAEYFHNHLVALKRDCEVRTKGIDKEDLMLADSTISLLKAIYTTKEDWIPAPAPIPVNATSPEAIEVATWNEIIGDAKSTQIPAHDFPIQEQDEEQIKGKRGTLESPAIKVTERPATKKQTKKKPRKGKETTEEKQARILAEVSDAVQDAHSWLYNVGDLIAGKHEGVLDDSNASWFARDIKAAIAEAEQLMLKLGSLAAEAVELGADWTHAILAEAEQTFDEIVAAIKTLGTKLPKEKKKKPPKKKRADYPVKKSKK